METNLTTLSDQLPEQIHLKQVLKLIGLDDRPIKDALYRLGLHSQYDGLPLYFSDETYAEESIFGKYPPRFYEDNYDPQYTLGHGFLDSDKKCIHQLGFYHNDQGDFAEISTFWGQNDQGFFHCISSMSNQLEARVVEYNQLYVDKVELQEFCTKLEVSGTDIPDEEQLAILSGKSVSYEERIATSLDTDYCTPLMNIMYEVIEIFYGS